MQSVCYKIYRLSARVVIGNGKERADGYFDFQLSKKETQKCILTGTQEQEDNALFYQIMDELHGGSFTLNDGVVNDLSDIIFFMDFSGIFDRTGRQKKYIDRQKKAESMFPPGWNHSELWFRGTPLSCL